MKTKKLLAVGVLASSLLLCGCGGYAYDPYPGGSNAPIVNGVDGVEFDKTDSDEAPMSYTSDISLETARFQQTSDHISDVIKKHKARIQHDYTNGGTGTAYGETGARTRTVEVQVKAEDLDAFLADLKDRDGMQVLFEQRAADTLGDAIQNNEDRIRVLDIEMERIEELMKKCEDAETLLDLQQRWTELNEEKTQNTQDLKEQKTSVITSTVSITLNECSASEMYGASASDELGESLAVGIGRMQGFFVGLISIVLFMLPELTFVALIAAAVLLCRKFTRTRKGKAASLENRPASMPDVPAADEMNTDNQE